MCPPDWTPAMRDTGTWRAMEQLYDEGKVKAIGVTNYSVRHLRQLLKSCRIRPMVNQVEFHPRLVSEDLVDQILNTDDSVLAKLFLDDGIVGEGYTAAFDLAESTLVDKFTYTLQVRVSHGDVWLSDAEHMDGGLVETSEGGIVNLTQTEQLQHLARTWVDTIDTSDSDDQGKLGLGWDVEVSMLLGLTGQTDLIALHDTVLLDVLLSTLEHHLPLLTVLLLHEEGSLCPLARNSAFCLRFLSRVSGTV